MATLTNDETATDKELEKYFTENGVFSEDAVALIEERAQFMKDNHKGFFNK